jgi:hypothetical protein
MGCAASNKAKILPPYSSSRRFSAAESRVRAELVIAPSGGANKQEIVLSFEDEAGLQLRSVQYAIDVKRTPGSHSEWADLINSLANDDSLERVVMIYPRYKVRCPSPFCNPPQALTKSKAVQKIAPISKLITSITLGTPSPSST